MLNLHVSAEPRLADLDYGRCHEQAIEYIRPDNLTVWLTDPVQAPHGGESIVNLIDRLEGIFGDVDLEYINNADDDTPSGDSDGFCRPLSLT